MRISVNHVAFEPSTDPGLAERVTTEALRQAAKTISEIMGHVDQPLLAGDLRVDMGIHLQKLLHGVVSEKAAAAHLAGKLVEQLLPRLAHDVVTVTKEGRKAYIFFGENLPDKPKTLETLLAERITNSAGSPESAHWLEQARKAMFALPDVLERIKERDEKVAQWVFAQGGDPANNPLGPSKLADSWHKPAAIARKTIKQLHAQSGTYQDFYAHLTAKANEMCAGADQDTKRAGTLLAHYRRKMEALGQEEIYAQDPRLGEVDQFYMAARMALQSTPTAPNFIKLPAGVPGLQEPEKDAFGKYKGKQDGEQAIGLARTTIAMARSMGQDPSHQYYFLDLRIQTYRRSGDPVRVLASIILSRYLEEQKAVWVPKYIEQVLMQAPDDREVSYDLAADVSYEGSDQKLPPDSRHVKKVQEAWNRIRKIVHPDVLEKVGPCKVKVHKNPMFRAHYSNREVHIASFESIPIIMHEFGHHLEDKGGLEPWIKVQRLLHERAAAGGGLKSITMLTPSELRYAADMPVTGHYSAKYYEHGSTEVMSMALEYFADPKSAAKLYMKDPEMFAAVLGSLNPTKII